MPERNQRIREEKGVGDTRLLHYLNKSKRLSNTLREVEEGAKECDCASYKEKDEEKSPNLITQPIRRQIMTQHRISGGGGGPSLPLE